MRRFAVGMCTGACLAFGSVAEQWGQPDTARQIDCVGPIIFHANAVRFLCLREPLEEP